ncbi:MAG: glycosyltransferase [Candidatus Levybacteria bacterium]|nr:glycosyltransferase [Candidatus Levybacteria bacterium]
MNIALAHDYIKEYGGAERVLEALHEIWPDAPVFTSVYLPEFLGPHKERFKNWNIRTSWLQFLPFKNKLISPIRLIAPFVFKSFDFSKFDVVIVSATGAYVKQFKIKNLKLKIVEYCHTPPRYLYGYATAREWKNNLIFRVFGEIANHFLRLVDFKSSQNVDFFIANSHNVAGRIKKFYRKDSSVIYPPAMQDSLLALRAGPPSTPYFLAGGRIARPKHIDLIIKTFGKLDLPLKVFGRGFAGADLSSKNSNIEFLGEVSDEEKIKLMRNAKAFVFAAEDEDFGITPVEAMSVGTPVIAFASGGILETIIDGQTGVLYYFNDLNLPAGKAGHLSEAIRKFEKMKFDRELIIKHAQKFSKERFRNEIFEFVNSKFKK